MIAAILLFATVAITPQSEIVLATHAPYATRLAAEELNYFMKGVFGEELPVVAERTPGRSAIVLGVGHQVEHRDGFVIEATNGIVRIFGNDDDVPDGDISKTCWYGKEAPWQPHFRRGTLFGVYEFLERHAGVRMYFPGKLGTIVPRADRLVVPDGRLEETPAFRYRRYGFDDGPQKPAFKLLNWYRLRMETETMKCVHGQRRLHLYERFGKTHPEYFANYHNKRIRERVRAKGHLCHSSKVWDEIEKDALKYFAEPAAKPMASFYDLLERKWTDCVAAGYAEMLMDAGLTTRHDATAASRKIFTPEVLGELEHLIEEAKKATTEKTLPRRRIVWIAHEYLAPLLKAYR